MTGPPFESHPASGATIQARAEGLAVLAGGAHTLSGDVRAAFAAAQGGVGGLLVGPMLSAPVRFYRTAARLHLGMMYAAGCLIVFANAVRDFDDGVDQLNAEWTAAVTDDFGIDAISLDTVRRPYGIDQHALALLQDDWVTDVDLARRELAADLRVRYRRLEERLDEAAHDVAGRLRHGPTAGGVRTMVDNGVFRQIYSDLEQRLDRLTPEAPSAIETLQQSGEPYICDGQGCRPAWPDMDSDGDAGPILEPIGSALEFLVLDDLEAALNGDPSAVGWLALDVVGGPIGHALKTVKHADEVVELAHGIENGEDALDAAEGATRIVPGGGLAAHEALGGHTLARHVGKTDQDLISRVLTDPMTNQASTFTDRATAEAAIENVLARHNSDIQRWLANGGDDLRLTGSSTGTIGRYVHKSTLTVSEVTGIRVVLRRDEDLDLGYHVFTAFPTP